MIINYLVPGEGIAQEAEKVREILAAKNVAADNMVQTVVAGFFRNQQRFAERGIDFWLGFGGYLPAVEWVIAQLNNEPDDEFYARTQYPKNVVQAYSVTNDNLATLVAADQYMQFHRSSNLSTTTVWPLNEDEEAFIDLALFEGRLKGLKESGSP